ncbi:hypothetical protein GCM10011514_41090 [Emticicia aquatilis]|uniref:Uncharacterized protein n=1 Tax=Emticicia aquatilis TaxID=1537369 RepID=A0A917DUP3_9BACT|nr:hypothetical protein [Emticicia aquatilis]GGD72782.1 hypothetical protein GCM10011514_41090 [Emticicia aquatilis]
MDSIPLINSFKIEIFHRKEEFHGDAILAHSGFYSTSLSFDSLLYFLKHHDDNEGVIEHLRITLTEFSKNYAEIVCFLEYPIPKLLTKKLEQFDVIDSNEIAFNKSDVYVIINSDLDDEHIQLSSIFQNKQIVKRTTSYEGGLSAIENEWLVDVVEVLGKLDGTVGGITAILVFWKIIIQFFKGKQSMPLEISGKLNAAIAKKIKKKYNDKVASKSFRLREDGILVCIYKGDNNDSYKVLFNTKKNKIVDIDKEEYF